MEIYPALVFAAIAVVFAVVAIRRRDWPNLAGGLMGTIAAELGFLAAATHENGFTILALVMAVGAPAVYLIATRRVERAKQESVTSQDTAKNAD